MKTKPHHERIIAELRADGVHVQHENGAKVVIPLVAFLRWCIRQLKEMT